MVRARFMLSALATFAVLATGSARAADYQPQPPPYVPPPPPPQECCAAIENWYLRGFVGVGMNANYKLDYTTVTNATLQHNDISDTYFVGGGVGYEFNNWLRFEATAEYRAKSRVYAFVTYPPGGLDEYQGYLKSWIFLANAFVDLGTWDCWTPFVGVGVGGAYNSLVDFSDVNPNGGFGFGRNPSEWHLAYALYAGVAYNVSKNFKIDLTYRYLNFGSITDTVDCSVTCNHDSFKFDKLYSNDIMLGLRWTCCETAPVAPRYVYQPQPYVPPPPLQSRG
ncbi:MAG TPA: outer membrane beta-barrel protein [Pseudolabrys sp.]|nr:outer membrane beta-barrel protein [Pseudolabrys sp.]